MDLLDGFSRNPLEPGGLGGGRWVREAGYGAQPVAGPLRWLAGRRIVRSAIQPMARLFSLPTTRLPVIASGWEPYAIPPPRQPLCATAITPLHRRWRLPAPELWLDEGLGGRRWLRLAGAPLLRGSGPASGLEVEFSLAAPRPCTEAPSPSQLVRSDA